MSYYFKRQTGIQTQTSHCENPSVDFLHANQTQENLDLGCPGGSMVKNPPVHAGDAGSISDPGRSHMLWSN